MKRMMLEAVDKSAPDAMVIYTSDHGDAMSSQPIRACFDGRYKLVINLLTSDELYDLKDDQAVLNVGAN